MPAWARFRSRSISTPPQFAPQKKSSPSCGRQFAKSGDNFCFALSARRHPERSRFSGGAKDLGWHRSLHARVPMIRKTQSVTLFLVVLCSAVSAQTSKQTLLALSKHDHTVAIVDPTTLKVIAKAPVGNDPHEVIASTDGKTAYVSDYGGGAYNTLAVIDLVAQKALPSIDLGALRGPHGLDFVGGKLWFTAEAAKAFGSYDPASHKIDLILGTGQSRTHMIYVFDDLQHIVTSNVSSGTISLGDKLPPRAPGPPPGAPAPPQGMQGPPPGPMGPPGGDWNETV